MSIGCECSFLQLTEYFNITRLSICLSVCPSCTEDRKIVCPVSDEGVGISEEFLSDWGGKSPQPAFWTSSVSKLLLSDVAFFVELRDEKLRKNEGLRLEGDEPICLLNMITLIWV